MEKVDIAIIGAGVIGLAIAERLSKFNKDIFVIEKENSFGQGISSRNSEVVHAGIYYPTESLKAKTCVEGRRMLYEICQKNNIPFKKLGKLIVASNKKEVEQIEKLYKLAVANGVENINIIDLEEIKELEPEIEGLCALFSPETGIVDSHKLMSYLYAKAKESGAGVVFESQIKNIQKFNGQYQVDIQDNNKQRFEFRASIVINSAGLYSDLIAELAGLDTKNLNYNLMFCKGQYFRLSSEKSRLVNRLVYPVPEQSDGGLGIHLTPDISGQVKIGPDAQYLNNRIEDYELDDTKQKQFLNSKNNFAPFIKKEDMYPDMAGIRPKLQGPNDSFRDFIIREESENGFPGFINLIGIESPGLTAAVSIAKYVENLIKICKN